MRDQHIVPLVEASGEVTGGAEHADWKRNVFVSSVDHDKALHERKHDQSGIASHGLHQ